MLRCLIVNADDLGLSRGTNLAIERAFRQGIVTSASLMVNMAAFEHAVEHVVRANPGLGIGLHLCLTSGRPVSPPDELPLLVGADGQFRHGFLGLLRILALHGAVAREQIARELEAQALRLDAAGVAIDHVNGHQHVHLIPAIFPLAARLARQRGAALRMPASGEPRPWVARLRRLRAWMGGGMLRVLILSALVRRARRQDERFLAADHCLGIAESGAMTLHALRDALRDLPLGVSELFVHPGLSAARDSAVVCSPLDQRFLRSPRRADELAAVTGSGLREMLSAQGAVLTTFRALRMERLLDPQGADAAAWQGERHVA